MKKENVDKFKKIWSNPRYKALIKLGLYFLFIILVCIYIAITNNGSSNHTFNNINNNINNETSINEDNEISNYIMNINITKNDKDINYLYKDNLYYIKENNNYLLINEENIYEIISNIYLDLDNINNYIKKGSLIKEEDNIKYYQISLKDVLLNYNEEECFYINKSNSNIKVDYTNLMKYLSDDITSFIIEIDLLD